MNNYERELEKLDIENHFRNISDSKKMIRIALSPIVFLWGVFLLCAGTLFPIPLLIMFSCMLLFKMPFVWLLKKGGAKFEDDFPFIDAFKSNALNHLAGITIYLWGAFAVAIHFIINGKVFTGE
jgi:hypothetical protein